MLVSAQLGFLAANDESFVPVAKRTNSRRPSLSSMVCAAGSIFVHRQFDRVGTNGRVFVSLAAGTIRSGALARRSSSTVRRRPCAQSKKALTDNAADFMRDELGVPEVVDRSTFHAELDALRVRGKAHTREGDAIADARRRLPWSSWTVPHRSSANVGSASCPRRSSRNTGSQHPRADTLREGGILARWGNHGDFCSGSVRVRPLSPSR